MARIRDIIEGLQLLEPYSGKFPFTAAEHDVLYTYVDCVPFSVARKLVKLGWHKDSEGGTWSVFT